MGASAIIIAIFLFIMICNAIQSYQEEKEEELQAERDQVVWTKMEQFFAAEVEAEKRLWDRIDEYEPDEDDDDDDDEWTDVMFLNNAD